MKERQLRGGGGLRRNLNRLIAVYSPNGYEPLKGVLFDLFSTNLVWENDMDYTVYRNERLDNLIEIAQRRLPYFFCVTDTGFNLICASKKIKPPNETFEHLMRTGCYDDAEIERLKRDVLSSNASRTVIYCPAGKTNSVATLQCPVLVNGSYVFHFTMALPPYGNYLYLKGLFRKFARRAVAISTEFWNTKIEVESPCHKMLIRLMNGERVERSYVNQQLDIAGIPVQSRFRLVTFRLDAEKPISLNNSIIEAAKRLNGERCHAFMHDQTLFVLCFTTSKEETSTSLNVLLRELADKIYVPFGVSAGVSQVFDDIKDINLAYRQTEAAFDHASLLKAMYPQGYFADIPFPAYPFDHVVQFILIEKDRDDDLIAFTMSRNNLQTLLAEDRGQGTTTVALLWAFVCCERNASLAASLMHVHRNTVLYHVRKFEHRFDVDLSCPMTRHRLVIDFLYYFSTTAE